MNNTPGIAVTDSHKNDLGWKLTGLKDPLSLPLEDIARAFDVSPDRLTLSFSSYESLHPELLLPRVRSALNTPESVSLDLKDGVLYVSGTSDAAWLQSLNQQLFLPSGINQIDSSEVHAPAKEQNEISVAPSPEQIAMQAAEQIAQQIRDTKIFFSDGLNIHPDSTSALDDIASLITDLTKLNNTMKKTPEIILVGNSDNTGDSTGNIQLRLERSSFIKQALLRKGVRPRYLQAMALKTHTQGGTVDPTLRHVEFRVRFKKQ